MADRDDDENDKTPPRAMRRPRSSWDDDRRAIVGREHRERETDTERQRQFLLRRRAQSRPFGVPVTDDSGSFDADEITPPIALLLDRDRELDANDRAMIQRLRDETPDPFEQLYKLAKDAWREKDRHRSERKEQEARLRELLDRPPKEVHDKFVADQADLKRELTEIKRFTDGQRKIINWLGGSLLSAVLAVGGFLYYRGVTEGENKVRAEQLDRRVEQLEHRAYRERQESK